MIEPAAPGARIAVLRRSARLERLRARGPRLVFVGLVVVLSLLGIRELAFPARFDRLAAPQKERDVAAEDFAQRFARAYLTYDAARPGIRERALRALAPEDLGADAGLTLGRSERVLWTEVAQDQEAIAGGRIVVVAAGVSTQDLPLYLAVPVARAADGALRLTGYPSLVGPPTAGRGQLVDRDEVEDTDVLAVARRAVSNYLAGERSNLEADLTSQAAVSMPTRELRVVSVDEVDWASGVGSSAVLATVTARDRERTTWTLTYEIGIDRRRGRPYVTFIETVPNVT
jgi:hypothetical protein